MNEANKSTPIPGPEGAVNARILERAQALNNEILDRFLTASADLDCGEHRAALGAIDGVDAEVQNLRCLLRLMEPQ